MSDGNPVLRVPEAAELLRISEATLRRWMKKPGFPVVRIDGGHPRFVRDELLRWMRERSQPEGQSA